MASVYIDPKLLLVPFCGAVVAVATIAYTCFCGRRYRALTYKDKEIGQINELARIIHNNKAWWLFEGVFRIAGTNGKIDEAIDLLREAESHDYEAIARLLTRKGVFQEEAIPSCVLKRLTASVMGSRNILRKDVEKAAPCLKKLLQDVVSNSASTRMAQGVLDIVFPLQTPGLNLLPASLERPSDPIPSTSAVREINLPQEQPQHNDGKLGGKGRLHITASSFFRSFLRKNEEQKTP